VSRHRRPDDEDELLEAPPSRYGYEPRYQRPAQRRYEAPAYEPPQYERPAYEPPAYEPPLYTPPAYEAPRYEAPPVPPAYPPAYEPPRYEAPPVRPAYTPPAYEPPAYPPPGEAPLSGYVARRPTPPLPSAARARKPPKAAKPAKQPQPRQQPAQTNRAGRLRLRVNPITCDGHGLCAELLPELLTRDDWGYPSPVVAEIPAELESHAQRAAQQCPTLAIVLERRLPRRDAG
jgi:ferredoxin